MPQNYEDYARAILVAKNQPFEFRDEVEHYFIEHAPSVSLHTYHFGNSSILFRTDVPPDLEEKERIHLALNMTAKNRKGLEEDIREILGEFPQFENIPFGIVPDPLYYSGVSH